MASSRQSYNDAMLKRLMEYTTGQDEQEPIDDRPVAQLKGRTVMASQVKPSTGQNIMSGISSALEMLNSGAGQKLSALAFKDPYVKQQMVGQGEQTQQQEIGQKNLLRQAYGQKMASAGDYLGKQAEMEQQERLAGMKAKTDLEEATLRSEKEKEDARLKAAAAEITQGNIDYDDYLKAHAAGRSSLAGVKLGKDPLDKPVFLKLRAEAAKRGLQ